ncbi:hypothetical protein HA402_008943 [Bradysia odoriphaga]|nr:hypothetical protein HA402_008943 [Bradysia odoriphaga]
MLKYCSSQISPIEIEQFLMKHDSIQVACVIGIPDPVAGERPAAVIILRENAEISAEVIEGMVAGSDLEKTDLKKAYLNCKGCINAMTNSIPFMGVENEQRFQEIVKEWIAAGEVPEYKMFTEEPKAKRTRRNNKYRKEALEARQIKEEMDAKCASNSLELQIMARQKSRGTSLIDSLTAKYGGGEIWWRRQGRRFRTV